MRRALGVLLAFACWALVFLLLTALCMPIIFGSGPLDPLQWFIMLGIWLVSLLCLGFFVAVFAMPARPYLWGAVAALVPWAVMAAVGADIFVGGPARGVGAGIVALAVATASALAGGSGGRFGAAVKAHREKQQDT
ncbi:MAG: hypothetical protein JSV65_04560 [Armatimonadota bacterium]|nr:MAG: hypothetical protein JSV65_04560 [Armatimonadota bacterium]